MKKNYSKDSKNDFNKTKAEKGPEDKFMLRNLLCIYVLRKKI